MRRICAALLLALLLFVETAALRVQATSMVYEQDGLHVTVTMDKEQYDAHEPISVNIVVRNVTRQEITITSLEQLIPEGYVLSEESKASMKKITLASGKSATLDVVLESEAAIQEEAAEESFWDVLIYGKTFGLPNILLALIAVAAFAIFMYLT